MVIATFCISHHALAYEILPKEKISALNFKHVDSYNFVQFSQKKTENLLLAIQTNQKNQTHLSAPVLVPDLTPASAPLNKKPLTPENQISSLNETKLPFDKIAFEILAAEIALQRAQIGPAYQTYLTLARETHNPILAKRAVQIALEARSQSDVIDAARSWRQFIASEAKAATKNLPLLVLSGDLQTAKAQLKIELLQSTPATRGQTILTIQNLLANAPDPAEALITLQDILKNELNLSEAHYALGQQQLLVNRLPQAKNSFIKALKLKPYSESTALIIAQFSERSRLQAIDIIEKFIAKNSDQQTMLKRQQRRDARVALAQVYLANQQLTKAREQFKLIQQADPNDLMPLLALGLIDFQDNRLDSAENLLIRYTRAIEKQTENSSPLPPHQLNYSQPDSNQANLLLAQIAISRNNRDQAQYYLDKIPSQSVLFFKAKLAYAQMFAENKNYSQALATLKELKPSNLQEMILVKRLESAVLSENKNFAQAEDILENLARILPEDESIAYDYALAAERNGHYKIMENELKRIIILNPQSAQAYNALGYSLVERNERLNEAEKFLEQALKLAPQDAYSLDSLAWLKFRQGKTEEALKILQSLWQKNQSAELGAHLGEVLWSMKKFEEAKAVWQKAKQIDSNDQTLIKTLQRYNQK